MTTASDYQLYLLYLDLGQLWSERGRSAQAADAYALGLYYAQRLDNPSLIEQCRTLVLENNAHHVAAQGESAPLFYAQLLMRYPADEARQTIDELRAHSAPSRVAQAASESHSVPTHEPQAPAEQPARSAAGLPEKPYFDLSAASKPSAGQAWAIQPPQRDFEQHHVFELGGGTQAPAGATVQATDDHLTPSREPVPDEASEVAAALHFAAVCSVIIGVFSVGFFGAKLYPIITTMDVRQVVRAIADDVAKPSPRQSQPEGSDGSEAFRPIENIAVTPPQDAAVQSRPQTMKR